MVEREKLIRAMEYCTGDIVPVDENDECLGDVCPFKEGGYESGDCQENMIRAALALLKEQEPRVMTLEELQAIETPWNRNTPPYLFVEERSAAGSRWMSWGFMRDFVRLWGTLNAKNYGSKWRVWNLQPTPEQMRETPWEGEKN